MRQRLKKDTTYGAKEIYCDVDDDDSSAGFGRSGGRAVAVGLGVMAGEIRMLATSSCKGNIMRKFNISDMYVN